MADQPRSSLYQRLRERGVIRAAVSYLVIAWLTLQIGDVVLDPLGAPAWTMRLLIIVAIVGFPVAIAMAWFLELTPEGIEVDTRDDDVARPAVRGVRRYADVVIIGSLLVVIAFLVIRPDTSEPPVVAVLPFEELDSTAGNTFGDGFADSLIHKLGMLEQLVVLAPASTFQFRDVGDDLSGVAQQLGAGVLLQGSLRRAGGLLRIDARLVDGGTQQLLWSGNFRRRLDEVFQLQEEIASAVATTLGLQLSATQVERISRPPTTSLNAYSVFIRAGREALESRDNERVREALQYIHDAIELDPDFALAHATLVEALYLVMSYRHWETQWEDFRDEAYAAARRAQELDPLLGEGYLAEAIAVHADRWKNVEQHSDEELIRLLEKALELSPSNVTALRLLSLTVDDAERKITLLKRAARVDPRSGIVRVNISENYARLGDRAQAEYWAIEAARSQEPFFRSGYKMLIEGAIWNWSDPARAARWGRALYRKYPEDWNSHLAYLRALYELRAWDEARAVLVATERAIPQNPDYFGWTYLHVGQMLAYAQRDLASARHLAERDKIQNLHVMPSWPDLSAQTSALLTSLDLLALLDIEAGRPADALQRFKDSNLDLDSLSWENFPHRAIRPVVLYAVLHRLTGEPERAEVMLQELLERVADQPLRGLDGAGFTQFTVRAFLGDAEAAADALQELLDENWFIGWWTLDFGRFDATYAAVLDDPRVQAMYREMEARGNRMLESYRENPELTEDELAAAGLL